MSDLVETANLAASYCPRCDPERDPVREILMVCWCDEHRPACDGADDKRATVGGVILESSGEASADTNRPWCDFLHRATRSNRTRRLAKRPAKRRDVSRGR